MTAFTPSRVMCKSVFLCDDKPFLNPQTQTCRSATCPFEDLACIIELCGAACDNTWTKRESLKILVVLSKCNYKTALIDVLYFHIAGPLEYFFGKWPPWVCETKIIFLIHPK